MITKQQAINAHYFHRGKCTKHIGPRGGVTWDCALWRRNGRTKTWKTRPNQWRIPVKYGLYGYCYIWHHDATDWHTAEDCKPRTVKVARVGGRRWQQ